MASIVMFDFSIVSPPTPPVTEGDPYKRDRLHRELELGRRVPRRVCNYI